MVLLRLHIQYNLIRYEDKYIHVLLSKNIEEKLKKQSLVKNRKFSD